MGVSLGVACEEAVRGIKHHRRFFANARPEHAVIARSEANEAIHSLIRAAYGLLRFARNDRKSVFSPSSPLRAATRHASLFGRHVAAPREARRAKRGGARRDRTADLLHAMQALSQLSYGPETLSFEHDLFGKPVTTFPDHAPRAAWATHGARP